MKGVQAYDCEAFHPDCNVVPVDIGGFSYLWCADCHVLANMQAVSYRCLHLDTACKAKTAKGIGEYRKADKQLTADQQEASR